MQETFKVGRDSIGWFIVHNDCTELATWMPTLKTRCHNLATARHLVKVHSRLSMAFLAEVSKKRKLRNLE